MLSRFQVSSIIFFYFLFGSLGFKPSFSFLTGHFQKRLRINRMLLFIGVDCRELPVCSTGTKTTNNDNSGGSSILNLRTGRVQVPGNI